MTRVRMCHQRQRLSYLLNSCAEAVLVERFKVGNGEKKCGRLWETKRSISGCIQGGPTSWWYNKRRASCRRRKKEEGERKKREKKVKLAKAHLLNVSGSLKSKFVK